MRRIGSNPATGGGHDLRTASRGRVNCLYVRADTEDPTAARMARLQRPQVILHDPPTDGTLRGAASALDIPALTLEVGDPQLRHRGENPACLLGVRMFGTKYGFEC